MTFYYDSDADELVGNNAFDDTNGFAEQDGSNLVLDVTFIMEEGRAIKKLKEIRNATQYAIDAHSDE